MEKHNCITCKYGINGQFVPNETYFTCTAEIRVPDCVLVRREQIHINHGLVFTVPSAGVWKPITECPLWEKAEPRL